MPQLKSIGKYFKVQYVPAKWDFIPNQELAPLAIEGVKSHYPKLSDYAALHYLINHENFPLPDVMQETIEQIEIDNKFNPTKNAGSKIMQRYTRIKQVMKQNVGRA